MFLITDLDNTLIYSHQPTGVCVENYDGKPLSFMTANAHKMLEELFQSKRFQLVPCTLRSWEQASRIEFIENGKADTVICDNGFSIYHNGKLDTDWDEYINSIVDTNAIGKMRRELLAIVERNKIPISQIKENRSAFLTIIFNDVETAERYSSIFLNHTDTLLYDFYRHKRKTYIIPKSLDKYLAVKYLYKRFPTEFFVTSGDSITDGLFVKSGNVGIIPRHAEKGFINAIQSKNSQTPIKTFSKFFLTSHFGIQAGEEIISYCHCRLKLP